MEASIFLGSQEQLLAVKNSAGEANILTASEMQMIPMS